MTDQLLTDALAVEVLGWRLAPDRYIKGGRNWIPRWRFSPLTDVANAFELLDYAAARYTVTCENGVFKIKVCVGNRWGQATGDHLARAITCAVAQATGIEVPS